MGIDRAATLAYSNDERGVREAFSMMGCAVEELRKSGPEGGVFRKLDIRPARSQKKA
jgi:hypothetical protein